MIDLHEFDDGSVIVIPLQIFYHNLHTDAFSHPNELMRALSVFVLLQTEHHILSIGIWNRPFPMLD